MKKYIIIAFVLLLSACSLGIANTPKEKVKELLDKYKNQDSEIMDTLDQTISTMYEGEYKDRYKKLIVKQYKNMDYKITDEVIEDDTAVVTADITVYDYASAIDSSNYYLSEHQDEFKTKSSDETTRDTDQNEQLTEGESVISNNTLDNNKFLDYKFNELEKVSDKKTYTINFSLIKEDDKWQVESLSDTDMQKLHGLYSE